MNIRAHQVLQTANDIYASINDAITAADLLAGIDATAYHLFMNDVDRYHLGLMRAELEQKIKTLREMLTEGDGRVG